LGQVFYIEANFVLFVALNNTSFIGFCWVMDSYPFKNFVLASFSKYGILFVNIRRISGKFDRCTKDKTAAKWLPKSLLVSNPGITFWMHALYNKESMFVLLFIKTVRMSMDNTFSTS